MSDRKLALLLFVLFAGIYAGTAGLRLRQPSTDTHFVYLADSWLHRRLDLGGLEMGYSRTSHTGLNFVDLSIIGHDGRFRRWWTADDLRVRFFRRKWTVITLASTPAGEQLLALRALANRPLGKLAAVSMDPVGAWRRQDPAAVRGLAALELRSAGIRASNIRPASFGPP